MKLPDSCADCEFLRNILTEEVPMWECGLESDEITSVLVDDKGKPFNFRPRWCMYDKEVKDKIEYLDRLPSSQLEIIHCGDCKYKDDGTDEDGIPFLKGLHGRSYGGTRINDFCSWAERR